MVGIHKWSQQARMYGEKGMHVKQKIFTTVPVDTLVQIGTILGMG